MAEHESLLAFREEMRAGMGSVAGSISKTQEQHQAMLMELTELRTEFSSLKADVHELKQSVGGLINLKHQGIGMLAAVGLLGALVFLGIKYWVADFVTALKAA